MLQVVIKSLCNKSRLSKAKWQRRNRIILAKKPFFLSLLFGFQFRKIRVASLSVKYFCYSNLTSGKLDIIMFWNWPQYTACLFLHFLLSRNLCHMNIENTFLTYFYRLIAPFLFTSLSNFRINKSTLTLHYQRFFLTKNLSSTVQCVQDTFSN